MERIILSIALILLLCGYYLTPSSRINYKAKKQESRTEVLLNKSGDTHNPIQNANVSSNTISYKK